MCSFPLSGRHGFALMIAQCFCDSYEQFGFDTDCMSTRLLIIVAIRAIHIVEFWRKRQGLESPHY